MRLRHDPWRNPTMKALLLASLVLLTALAIVPAADARDPPECMQMYSRTDVGTISIVRRDTCHAEYYQCPYEGAPVSECDHLLG